MKPHHRTATIYTKPAKYYNEHKAWAFESPGLEAEIVIKLRREMDAKIGLDTNYQKERHLCKFTRSLNFSSTETQEEETETGRRRERETKITFSNSNR